MSGRLPITYGRLGKKRAENSNRRASHDSPSSPVASPSRPQASSKLRTHALAVSSTKAQRMHSDSPDPILLVPESPSRIVKPRTPHHSPISKIVTINPPTEVTSVTPSKRKRTLSQGKTVSDPDGGLQSTKKPKRALKQSDTSPERIQAEYTTPIKKLVTQSPSKTPSRLIVEVSLRSIDRTKSVLSKLRPEIEPKSPAAGKAKHGNSMPQTFPSRPRSVTPTPPTQNFVSPLSNPAPGIPNTTKAVPSSTPSPRKIPRDLSGIFEEIKSAGSAPSGDGFDTSASPTSFPSRSASGTPRKKRMLGRAATLPDGNAFGVSPVSTPSSLLKTSSLPIISPSKKGGPMSTTTSVLDRDPSLSSSSISAPAHTAIPSRPNVRTYSQARSFLIPIPPSPDAKSSETQTNVAESQVLHRESYADLRKRFRVDISSDDEIEEGLMGPLDLKSISELRDKGENRRFLDEIGYLLEGLDSKMTIAVKRLSSLKLLENMCEVEFMRKIKVADALGSAWIAMRKSNVGTGDKVLDLCLVAFSALATRRDSRLADEFARQPDLDEFFRPLLEWTCLQDPFGFDVDQERSNEARALGIGKPERILIAQIRALVRKAKLLPEDGVITSRILLSKSLTALHAYRPSLLNPLLDSLLPDFNALSARIESYIIGLPILPSPTYDAPDLHHVDNCLRLIEGMLLDDRVNGEARMMLDASCLTMVNGLISTCIVCQVVLKDESAIATQAMETLISALRLLVNLADSSYEWCLPILRSPFALATLLRIISSYQPIPLDPTVEHNTAHAEAEANKLDVMCLALAIVTSIVQEVKQGKVQISKTKLDPSCKFTRSCLKGCHCARRVGAVESLVRLYLDQTERSRDLSNAEATFLKGHLAVLLGLLCDDRNNANRTVILRLLPGDSSQLKLDAWIETIRDFVGLYADLAKRFVKAAQDARSEPSHDPETDGSDVDRGDGINDVQTVLGDLRHAADISSGGLFAKDAQGSEKGVELANRVIGILQSLRED